MISLSMIPQKQSLELFCSQGDKTLRKFIFELYNGRNPVLLDGTETIEFEQSNGVTHQCSIENGHVILDTHANMTALPGRFRSRLKITEQDGGVVHSAVFTLKIEEAA